MLGQVNACAIRTRQKTNSGRASTEAVERNRRGKRRANSTSDGGHVRGHVDRDGDERQDRGNTKNNVCVRRFSGILN